MKTPKMLYVLIGIFCVFAIIAGAYAQFVEKGHTNNISGTQNNVDNNKVNINDKTAETIKNEFQTIFTNTINLNEYDDTNIKKIKADEKIVYSPYNINENKDSYEINIHIPVVNINSEVASSFNKITQEIFANKANEVLKKTDTTSKTIYSIDYVAYVNNNILSLVIRSTLKEAESVQRVIIQTYNYNLQTNTSVTLNDAISLKSLNEKDVENKIQSTIKEADDQTKAILSMGYSNIYTRDLNNDMYKIANSKTFFLGENGKLYIIYAYGNQNFTSEMDIVLFE